MKCPTCGAENGAGNRFCEQFGPRIEPSGECPPAQHASATRPAPASRPAPAAGDYRRGGWAQVAEPAVAALSRDAPPAATDASCWSAPTRRAAPPLPVM